MPVADCHKLRGKYIVTGMGIKMKDAIFRKKSLERISSPEEIDDYMKVTSPGMWLVMAAIILLLVAAIVWSITGHIETTLNTTARAENGQVAVEIAEEQMGKLTVGSEVRAENKTGEVTGIREQEDGYLVTAFIPELEDGPVNVTLVTERIIPITFLTK